MSVRQRTVVWQRLFIKLIRFLSVVVESVTALVRNTRLRGGL